MSDRDETPVTIKLDRQRPYRAKDSDRDAIWVGPGECQVPRWVAQAWGMTIPPPPVTPPAAPDPPPVTQPDTALEEKAEGERMKDEITQATATAQPSSLHPSSFIPPPSLQQTVTVTKAQPFTPQGKGKRR